MNEVKIFNSDEFCKIKDFQNSKPNTVMGIIYAIGYNNGYSKIGMSSVPAERVSVLKHYISDYMQKPVEKIMISKWHTNYRQNEKLLHKAFSDCCIPNTELFAVDVGEIESFIVNDGIVFEDRSAEMLEEIEKVGNGLIEFGKSVLRGDYDAKKDGFSFSKMYEDMLNSSDYLTEEIIFTTRCFVDDYRAALEDYAESEIAKIKTYFVDKWIEHGFIDQKF